MPMLKAVLLNLVLNIAMFNSLKLIFFSHEFLFELQKPNPVCGLVVLQSVLHCMVTYRTCWFVLQLCYKVCQFTWLYTGLVASRVLQKFKILEFKHMHLHAHVLKHVYVTWSYIPLCLKTCFVFERKNFLFQSTYRVPHMTVQFIMFH